MKYHSNVGEVNFVVADFPREKRFEVFDELPPKIREAFRYASEDYSIYQVWYALSGGYNTEEEIVAALKGDP